MVAGLVDEPYLLRMEDVAQLTPRQVSGIYYRPRNDKGAALPLPYAFETVAGAKAKAFEILTALGMTEDEARRKVYGNAC